MNYVFSGILDVESLQLKYLMIEIQNFLLELFPDLHELLVIHKILLRQENIINLRQFETISQPNLIQKQELVSKKTNRLIARITSLNQQQSTFQPINNHPILMNQRAPRHFIDLEKISKHLYCSICHEVFDNPTRMRCGHTFCYECMFNWRKMSKTCPECKTKAIKWLPEKDLVAAHIIDDFMTKCSFGTCEWKGLYSFLKKHQRFCTFRQKRQYDEVSGQEVVKVPDEAQDSEVQQVMAEHKNGRKKVKKNQDADPQPRFPESSQSLESINMQPLEPNRRSSSQPANSHHESQGVPYEQNQSHVQSSSSDGYLEINLTKMIKNGKPQFSVQNGKSQKIQHMECENDHEKNEEKKQQKHISRQFREIRMEDDDQFRLYPRFEDDEKKEENQCRKGNRAHKPEDSDDQQEFFRLLNYKNEQSQNLYFYRKRLQQQQRLKKENQQRRAASRWKIVHPESSQQKAQNSGSSDMSNPFEEPIPSKPKKKSKIKEFIIVDSQEENQVEMSKQSGEISEKLHKQPITKFNSMATQSPDSNGDSPKEYHEDDGEKKEVNPKLIRHFAEEHAKKVFGQSKYKKESSKQDTFEY